MDNGSDRQELLTLTTEIVAAFAGNNAVAMNDLPSIISSVYAALSTAGAVKQEPVAEAPVPAVPVRKSIGNDYIICLEDGKKLKMLKRHLASRYQMTPEEYRRRWGLPNDYPMVAPAYAAQRSALAKEIGLGRKPAETPAAPVAAPAAPARRVGGRRKAAAAN
ncbi:MAG: MucR family transcriptional regulator [Geminicoccaceae bacterium]